MRKTLSATGHAPSGAPRGAQPLSRTPLNNSILSEDTLTSGHFRVTIPNDPHAVACPRCGARPMQPCQGRLLRRMTVHAARADRWRRTVAR